MNINNLVDEVTNIFRTNLKNFCEKEDVSTLTPELATTMIKRTKEIISMIGCQTLKCFFEGFDTDLPILQEDGIHYRLKYNSSREFLTPVGKVRISRNVYQNDRGGKSIVPLDRYWNMENQYMCEEVQESLLYSCAYNTPEETANLFDKISLYAIHPTTIKKLLEKSGNFIEEHKDEILLQTRDCEQLESAPDIMVASMDGVNVLLDEKGKRKGRPKERPGNEKEHANTSYKNAMCGTISFYEIQEDEKTGKKSPNRTVTKYIARMPEERYPKFKQEFEQELVHFGSIKPQKKLLLTDGHKSIQGYIKGNPMFADFDWMLDYYHATEHLSKLAEIMFGKSDKKGQSWYNQKSNELKHKENGAEKVIRSAEYYISKLRKSNKKEAATKELRYFKKHKKLMNYKLHLENGWPIGSGVVEAACKSIVKQRMCRSGQRWSRTGGRRFCN